MYSNTHKHRKKLESPKKPLPDLSSLQSRFPKMKTASSKLIRQLRDESH